ncbi:MAG: tetratricopeptide repeat protein [Bacteroidia bacterium]
MKQFSRYLFVFLLGSSSLIAGNPGRVDSLLSVLNSAPNDTNRVNILKELSLEFRTDDTLKALDYAKQSMDLARRLGFTKGVANAYARIGSVYKHQKEFEKAVKYYKLALAEFEKAKYTQGRLQTFSDIAGIYKQQASYDDAFDYYTRLMVLATQTKDTTYLVEAHGGYANIYRYRGDYVHSLNYYLSGVSLAEAINDKKAEAGLLTNMAIIYSYQGNAKEELKIRERAMAIYIETKDSTNMIIGNNNLGEIYYEQGDKARALERFNAAMNIIQLIGEKRAGEKYIGQTYEQFAIIAFDEKNYAKAKENYQKALDHMMKGKEKKATASCYGELADVAIATEKWNEAEELLMKKLNISREIEHKKGETECYQSLAKVMYGKSDYKKAYEYQSEYLKLNQELLNETSTEQLAEMQTRFETEKKEKELQLQTVEIANKDSEVALRTKIMYAFIGISAIFLMMAFFSMRQHRQKKRAVLMLQGQNKEMMVMNQQISFQKEIIEEKNKDITDSIHYAKHIQEAILPPDDMVYEYLKESFILYKPKDIVSGDIYWLHKQQDKIYFAAVDCTGHGVPGALMSVVAYSGLNSLMSEERIRRPADVLNNLSDNIKETFKHQYLQEQINDGMDIALCALDRKNMTLSFSGAKSPLCVVRGEELIEIKGDKHAIEGRTADFVTAYTHNEMKVQPGDCIYVFSDGYNDQFGGTKGKKFKYSQLKQLLISIASKPMHLQKAILSQTLEEWKGNLQQVDDILLIGVRV